MKIQEWFANYDLWINDCKTELLNKGLKAENFSTLDICENGQVYFGNLTITHKGYVTPWTESKQFVN